MKRLRHILLAGFVLTAMPQLHAEPVDPFVLVEEAMQAYQARESYADMRAVLSRGLRDAAAEGPLPPGFAIVYAIYSDMARFEGNASFALHLAEEGVRLVQAQEEVDREYENILLVSRAYALAELGRFAEAVDGARIPAVWMEERFGAQARRDLEAEISGWAARASADGSGALPDAVQLAIDLLSEAENRANAGDTAAAHALASRAMLPESAGLDETSLRFINAWSHTVSGYAFRLEGRPEAALRAMRLAADIVLGGTWDGQAPVRIAPSFTQEAGERSLVWDIFSNIGAMAAMLRQTELATAALDIAEPFAITPDRRFSLLVQRGAIMLANEDLAGVETAMERSAADARDAGDEANATLAELYSAITRLHRHPEPDENVLSELVRRARLAVEAATDAGQREFILTMAVQQGAQSGAAAQTLQPLAREAFAEFRKRQNMMRAESVGQDSVRRERRRFLETFIDIHLDLAGG